MIAENEHLIPESAKISWCKQNTFLTIALDVAEELMQSKDPMDEMAEQIQLSIEKRLEETEEKILEKVKEINNAEKSELLKTILQVKGDHQEILQILRLLKAKSQIDQ